MLTSTLTDILLALNNEVQDVHLVAEEANDLLRLAASDQDLQPPKSLRANLESIQSILLQLEEFLHYELMKAPKGSSVRLDTSVYLRKQPQLQRYKDEIRDKRIALSFAFSLLASSAALGTYRRTREVQCSIELLNDSFSQFSTPMLQFVEDASRWDLHINQAQSTSFEPPQQRPRSLASKDDQVLGDCSPAITRQQIDTQSPVPLPLQRESVMKSSSANDFTVVKVAQRTCHRLCRCLCHSYRRYRSPSVLNSVLGSLFIGYRARPIFPETCDDQECQQSSQNCSINYMFPSWLVNWALSFSFRNSSARGPEAALRVLRTRDFSHILTVFQNPYSSFGFEEMRRMLDAGEASIVDIDVEGTSVLQHAVQYSQWKVVHLLLSLGADLHHESNDSTSAFISAWRARWSFDYIPNETLEVWNDLFFYDHSWRFDSFAFPELHKAYLGLSGNTFEEVLAVTNREAINDKDQFGQTSLHWACGRGDSDAVTRLLACGADPNKQDMNGASALHFVVDSKCTTAHLLLDAKASVNLRDRQGYTPLFYIHGDAGEDETRDLLHRLVDLGAEVDFRDRYGQTPLFHYIQWNRFDLAVWVVTCGADANARNLNGTTPLLQAVTWNSHLTLNYLILNPMRTDLEARDERGKDVMMLAAYHGNLATLDILKEDWPAEPNIDFVEALETARYRRDYNSSWSRKTHNRPDEDPKEWYEAFVDMVRTIEARQGKGVISDLENSGENVSQELKMV